MQPKEDQNPNTEPAPPQPVTPDVSSGDTNPASPPQPGQSFGQSQQPEASAPSNMNPPTPDHPLFNQPDNSTFGPQKPKRGKLKLFLISLLAIILLAAGAAAAYLGIYLPNTPENVLKQSVANTLSREQISAKGSVVASGANSATSVSLGALSVDYSLQLDTVKKAASAKLDASITGVKIPVEARFIEENAYVKFGDLSTAKSLAKGFAGPQNGKLIDGLAAKITNRWIEIDKSLLSSTECPISSDYFSAAEDSQLEQIFNLYEQNEFVSIKNTSEDNVEGQEVTKYDLNLNKATFDSFSTEFNKLQAENLPEGCKEALNNSQDQGGNKDDQSQASYELSVWVDKSKKEVAKVSLKSDSKSQGTSEIEIIFNDEPVDIQKPENPIPALQLIGEITQLLGGGASAGQGQNIDVGNDIFEIET